MTLMLDHLAISCRTLDTGVAWVEERLGVTMQPGGSHALFGTHNRLLGLADGIYLEVIAPDPAAPAPDRPRWFGLDAVGHTPHLANWICRSDDLRADHAAAPPEVGEVVAVSRGALHWQITVPPDGSLPMGGGYPTLIAWADPLDHPAFRLPASGCRLTRLTVHHPDAATLARSVKLADRRVQFAPADAPRFEAVFDTPAGPRVLA